MLLDDDDDDDDDGDDDDDDDGDDDELYVLLDLFYGIFDIYFFINFNCSYLNAGTHTNIHK